MDTQLHNETSQPEQPPPPRDMAPTASAVPLIEANTPCSDHQTLTNPCKRPAAMTQPYTQPPSSSPPLGTLSQVRRSRYKGTLNEVALSDTQLYLQNTEEPSVQMAVDDETYSQS